MKQLETKTYGKECKETEEAESMQLLVWDQARRNRKSYRHDKVTAVEREPVH